MPVQMVDLGHGGMDVTPRVVGPVAVATTARLGDYVLADTSGGAFLVTLPAADRIGTVHVKLHGGASVVIDAAGTDTIDGAATLTLTTTGETVTLVCDGDGSWYKLGGAFALSSLEGIFQQVIEPVLTVADAGATYTVPEPSAYGAVDITLTQDCTLVFPADSQGKMLHLVIRQDATGGWSVTWPVNTVFVGGATAQVTLEPNSVDYIVAACVVEDRWGIVHHSRMRLPQVNTVAASGVALTVPEPSLYEYSDITLTDNCVLTFPAASQGKTLKMVFRQDGVGAHAVTWPAGTLFPGGTDVVITAAASAIDYVEAFCVAEDVWMVTRVGAAYAV